MTSHHPGGPSDSSPVALYRKFRTEHEQADVLCKRVQQFRDKAGIPAINEMRYAGYHLCLSLDENGRVADSGELLRAIGHAQRAMYEAAEAGIQLALREIHLFRDDYRKVLFTDIVSDWLEILTVCEEAKATLGIPRATGDGKVLDHVRHKEMFDILSSAANRLHVARPQINLKMEDARTVARRWIVGIIAAAAVSVIATIANIFKDKILSFF